MHNYLQEIIANKKQEVANLNAMLEKHPDLIINKILRGEYVIPTNKSFKQALQKNKLHIIAEIKRRSPAKGLLDEIADPVKLAKTYVTGGADALSVLTDSYGFGGSQEDLKNVAAALVDSSCPILRKDFILDAAQIAQAICNGANAVLLIVALLKDQTPLLLNKAKQLGIDVLVEVHDYDELQVAIDSGAEMIGVNNRNLTTFAVDIDHSLQLAQHFPSDVIKISESGIHTVSQVKVLAEAGYNALLIGEALVRSDHPDQLIAEMKHVVA